MDQSNTNWVRSLLTYLSWGPVYRCLSSSWHLCRGTQTTSVQLPHDSVGHPDLHHMIKVTWPQLLSGIQNQEICNYDFLINTFLILCMVTHLWKLYMSGDSLMRLCMRWLTYEIVCEWWLTYETVNEVTHLWDCEWGVTHLRDCEWGDSPTRTVYEWWLTYEIVYEVTYPLGVTHLWDCEWGVSRSGLSWQRCSQRGRGGRRRWCGGRPQRARSETSRAAAQCPGSHLWTASTATTHWLSRTCRTASLSTSHCHFCLFFKQFPIHMHSVQK